MANGKPKDGKAAALRRDGTLNPRPKDVVDQLFQENEFFDARDLVQVKYEMLRQVRVDKSSVSQSAHAFGLSRPSYYQAQAAFEEAGLAGLAPEKRGPKQGHKLTPEVLEFVEQIRIDQPSLKPAEVVGLIQERFDRHVHPRSIRRALLRQKKKRL
jgi:transposase